jgi:hypothetical protein
MREPEPSPAPNQQMAQSTRSTDHSETSLRTTRVPRGNNEQKRAIKMAPRFYEPKNRVQTGILAAKGGRTVRKKGLGHKKKMGVVSSGGTTATRVIGLASRTPGNGRSTTTIDAAATEDSASNHHGEVKFIGGELLVEHDGSPGSDAPERGGRHQRARPPTESGLATKILTPLSKADRQNRCLAFDTRSLRLVIPSTTKATKTLHHHHESLGNDMTSFVEHLAVRGYTSPILAWTNADPSKRGIMTIVDKSTGATRQLSYTSGVGIQTTTSRHCRHHLPNIQNVTIQSSNASFCLEQQRGQWKLSEIPNTLTADFTWNLMADLGTLLRDNTLLTLRRFVLYLYTRAALCDLSHTLFDLHHTVQAIIEAGKGNDDDGSKDITILSSEVAFFTDVDLDAHRAGFDAFVARVAPLYANGQINEVEIALVSTGSSGGGDLLHSHQKEEEDESTHNASDGAGNAADDSMLACIDMLRRKMEDWEYRHLSTTTTGEMTTTTTTTIEKRVQVSLERIGSSHVGALTLARRWVRERIGRRQSHRIALDLPETLDGSQCTVSFHIMYQVCPVSLASPRMDDLMADLEVLASSGLEVVQRIPLSSLDARYDFATLTSFPLHSGLDCAFSHQRS